MDDTPNLRMHCLELALQWNGGTNDIKKIVKDAEAFVDFATASERAPTVATPQEP